MADGSLSREKFPAADAKGELNPGENRDFNVDSKSSEIATNKLIKPEEDGKAAEKKGKNHVSMQSWKTAVIITAVVGALAGAAFAIAKKMREK